MTMPLRDGSFVDDPRLDRLPSHTTEHLEKYPLTAATAPDQPQPVLGGMNWYSSADDPRQVTIGGRQRWVIGDVPIGRLRGGHCTVFKPPGLVDLVGWWDYYNQQLEGRCVEHGMLRMMTLLNRKRYDITSRWHYWMAQYLDEWAGGAYMGAVPSYEGTSVRAGLEVLRRFGAIPARPGGAEVVAELPDPNRPHAGAKPAEGISAYRWMRDWDQVRQVTGTPDDLPGVEMLQSWGRLGYPHVTLMLDDLGDRLVREDGEFATATDR